MWSHPHVGLGNSWSERRDGHQATISLLCLNQVGIDDARSLFPYLLESRKLCFEKFNTFISLELVEVV